MPDTAWPISSHPPGSIPGWAGRPVSMSSIADFDTSSVDRFRSPSWPTPDTLTARLTPRTLTTTALDRSSSGWFAASPAGDRGGPPDPTARPPPSPMQHRINRSDLLHRPPLRVRGTPYPSTFAQKTPVPDHPTVRTGPDGALRAPFSCPERRVRSLGRLLRVRPRHPSCPTRAVLLQPGSTAPSRSSGRAERGSRSERSTHTFPAGALLDANRNLLEEMAVVQTRGERVFDSRSRAGSRCILRPRYATA
jgi:hypothetical protein